MLMAVSPGSPSFLFRPRRSDQRDVLIEAPCGGIARDKPPLSGHSRPVFPASGTGGAIANPRIKAATKELVAAFVQGQFAGDGAQRLGDWHQRHQGLLARWVPPSTLPNV